MLGHGHGACTWVSGGICKSSGLSLFFLSIVFDEFPIVTMRQMHLPVILQVRYAFGSFLEHGVLNPKRVLLEVAEAVSLAYFRSEIFLCFRAVEFFYDFLACHEQSVLFVFAEGFIVVGLNAIYDIVCHEFYVCHC
jgi:hypothetical protein